MCPGAQGVSYGIPLGAANAAANSSIIGFIHSFFTESIATYDAGIAIWAGTRYYDAVQPAPPFAASTVTRLSPPGAARGSDLSTIYLPKIDRATSRLRTILSTRRPRRACALWWLRCVRNLCVGACSCKMRYVRHMGAVRTSCGMSPEAISFTLQGRLLCAWHQQHES
jgi:hypothetical protein